MCPVPNIPDALIVIFPVDDNVFVDILPELVIELLTISSQVKSPVKVILPEAVILTQLISPFNVNSEFVKVNKLCLALSAVPSPQHNK